MDADTAVRNAHYHPEALAGCIPTARGDGARAVHIAYPEHPPETEESYLTIVAAERVIVQCCSVLHTLRAGREPTRLRCGDSIIADHSGRRSNSLPSNIGLARVRSFCSM